MEMATVIDPFKLKCPLAKILLLKIPLLQTHQPIWKYQQKDSSNNYTTETLICYSADTKA